MISDNAKFDQFITDHRWATLTCLRKDGSPLNALVAYAREGDTLVVSTPGGTLKRRAIARDARVNLCVFNDAAPFNYVAVEGTAVIETTDLEAATRAVFANITGFGFPLPEDLPGWLRAQARVIIRITPTRTSGVIR